MWVVLYSCLSPADGDIQSADLRGTDTAAQARPDDDSGNSSETGDSAPIGLDDSGSVGPDDTSEPDVCAWMTWNNVGQPFFKTWCTACHSAALPEDERQGAPDDTNFDSYEGVLDHSSDIRAKLMVGSMPPKGSPPDDLKSAVLQWLECGAPR
jgi:cytochrome c5